MADDDFDSGAYLAGLKAESAPPEAPFDSDAYMDTIKPFPEVQQKFGEAAHAVEHPLAGLEGMRAGVEKQYRDAGYSEAAAKSAAERWMQRKAPGAGLTSVIGGLFGMGLSPATGTFSRYVSKPIAKQTANPEQTRQLIEGYTGAAIAAAGIRPMVTRLPRSSAPPLEGEILPPERGPAPGGPQAPPPEPPTIELQAEPRPNLDPNVRLIPPTALHSDRAAGSAGAARTSSAIGALSPEALAALEEKWDPQGFTPWTIEDRIEQGSPHEYFGEVTPDMEGHMGGIRATPGQARNEITQSVRQRHSEAPERIGAELDDAFGEPQNVPEWIEGVKRNRREVSNPYWQAFDSMRIPPTDALRSLLKRLRAVGATSAANKALESEGKPLTDGFPDNVPIEDQEQAPTAQWYQYAKEDLDDQISASANKPNERRRLQGIKAELIDAIDNHPDPTVAGVWKLARDTWAGPTGALKAREFGQKVLSGKYPPDVFREMWEGMSQENRDAAFIGIRDQLARTFGGVGGPEQRAGNVLRLLRGEDNQEIIRIMLGDERAEQLFNALQHETRMRGAPDRLIYGSPTAERTAYQRQWQPPEGGGPIGIGRKVLGFIRNPVHGTVDAAEQALKEQQEARWQNIRDEIGRVMTLQGPEAHAAWRELTDRAAARRGAPGTPPGGPLPGGTPAPGASPGPRQPGGGGTPAPGSPTGPTAAGTGPTRTPGRPPSPGGGQPPPPPPSPALGARVQELVRSGSDPDQAAERAILEVQREREEGAPALPAGRVPNEPGGAPGARPQAGATRQPDVEVPGGASPPPRAPNPAAGERGQRAGEGAESVEDRIARVLGMRARPDVGAQTRELLSERNEARRSRYAAGRQERGVGRTVLSKMGEEGLPGREMTPEEEQRVSGAIERLSPQLLDQMRQEGRGLTPEQEAAVNELLGQQPKPTRQPLRREGTRGRGGRPTRTEPLPDIDEEILERGYERATAGRAEEGEGRGRGELPGEAGGVEAPRGANPATRQLGEGEPLAGLPAKITVPGQGQVTAGPHEPIRAAARQYMADAGLPYNPPLDYAKVDPERAARIAAEYDRMPHAPEDPEVKAAYEQMARETLAQYQAAKKAGLKVDFIPAGSPDPYAASPRLAIEDIRNNNHMWVFSTRDGFGTREAFDPSSSPLLAESGEKFGGQPALMNDVFRVVHDYFGHAKEGVGFRADGEENAWRSHAAMYSPEGRRAMTSETRGQNSWLNFGPHGEANRTAKTENTVFADQKTGLLPDWVVNEGSGQEAAKSGLTVPDQNGRRVSVETTYPRASDTVDGLKVRRHIPNTDSIGATFGHESNYSELPGVRDVPFSMFSGPDEITSRTRALGEAIQESGEINPLIVAIDDRGPWILEGGHRYDALQHIGKTRFPALVVVHNSALEGPAPPARQTLPMTRRRVENAIPGPEDEHPARVGQAMPTLKRGPQAENPHSLTVSGEALRADPEVYAQNAALLRPLLPRKYQNIKDPEKIAEAFTSHVADNLKWLHNQIAPEIRERSRQWYDGGRAIVDQWSKQYGVKDSTAAAVLAALSPQVDWYRNVSLANRVLHTMRGMGDNFYRGFTTSPEMRAAFDARREVMGKYEPAFKMLEGKSLGDIDKMDLPQAERTALKALWVRFYDEAHHSRDYYEITPEGGQGKQITTQTKRPGKPAGSPASAGWQSLADIGKAVRAVELDGGNPSEISRIVGQAHKVRNFYNNLLNPNSKLGDVTIDTHAVAAGLLAPESGHSVNVLNNFGSWPGKDLPSSAYSGKTGISGTYPFFADAYRRAAADLGILPRELQSITWEAVRGLFNDNKKPQLQPVVENIWRQWRKGKISLDDARQQIVKVAGAENGIPAPSWFGRGGRGADAAADVRGTGDATELPGSGVRGEPAEGAGRRGGSEPAGAPAQGRARDVTGRSRTPADTDIMKRQRGGAVMSDSPPLSTRKESNYSPTRGTAEHRCEICAMFRKPHSCTEVGGFIARKGGCDWFESARSERAAGGRLQRAEGGDTPPPDDMGDSVASPVVPPDRTWESPIGPRERSEHRPEMRSYEPTWRDRIANALLPDNASYHAKEIARRVLGSSGVGHERTGAVDMVPIAGNVLGAQEDLQHEDYPGMAGQIASGVMPGAYLASKVAAPAIGPAMRAGISAATGAGAGIGAAAALSPSEAEAAQQSQYQRLIDSFTPAEASTYRKLDAPGREQFLKGKIQEQKDRETDENVAKRLDPGDAAAYLALPSKEEKAQFLKELSARKGAASAAEAEKQAEFTRQQAATEAQRKAEVEEEERKAKLPFRRRYPLPAAALQAGFTVGAGVLPYMSAAASSKASNLASSELSDLVRRAEDAITRGDITGARLATNTIEQKLAGIGSPRTAMQRTGDVAKGVAKTAGLINSPFMPYEGASLIPNAWDYYTHPEEDPLHNYARNQIIGEPGAENLGIGVLEGLGPAMAGHKLAKIRNPVAEMPTANARAAVRSYEQTFPEHERQPGVTPPPPPPPPTPPPMPDVTTLPGYRGPFGGAAEAGHRNRVRREAQERFDRTGSYRARGGAVNHEPTDAQKEAGNYKKDHIRVHGLDISIENQKGSTRSGVGKDGKPWNVTMPYHYGYIRGTEGADGDHLDVCLGPHLGSDKIYVVHQNDADSGRYDEQKVFIGFGSEAQVRAHYNKGFSDGRGKDRMGHIAPMSVRLFKEWLKHTQRPKAA